MVTATISFIYKFLYRLLLTVADPFALARGEARAVAVSTLPVTATYQPPRPLPIVRTDDATDYADAVGYNNNEVPEIVLLKRIIGYCTTDRRTA